MNRQPQEQEKINKIKQLIFNMLSLFCFLIQFIKCTFKTAEGNEKVDDNEKTKKGKCDTLHEPLNQQETELQEMNTKQQDGQQSQTKLLGDSEEINQLKEQLKNLQELLEIEQQKQQLDQMDIKLLQNKFKDEQEKTQRLEEKIQQKNKEIKDNEKEHLQFKGDFEQILKSNNEKAIQLITQEKQIQDFQNQIENITQEIKEKEINNHEEKAKLQMELEQIQLKFLSSNEDIDNYVSKIQEFEIQIEREKEKLKKETYDHQLLKVTQNELQNFNLKLKEQNDKIEEDLKEKCSKIEKLEEKELQILSIKDKIEEQKKNKQSQVMQAYTFDSNNPSEEDSSKYFYDITIYLKSLYDLQISNLSLKQQSDRRMLQRSVQLQQHNKEIDKSILNSIIVGIQGFNNESNQYILNSLVEDYSFTHLNLSNQGLYVKVQGNYTKRIVYLNSKISNNPITLNYEENVYYKQFMDQQLNHQVSDSRNELKLQEQIRDQQLDLISVKQIESDFIIENSNILVVIIPQITLEYQRYIHRLNECFIKTKKNSNNKKIIVVHYLEEVYELESIRQYVQYLMKAFPLIESSINEYPKKYEDENSRVLIDTMNTQIHHLIMGNLHSEAGRVYNQFSLFYLKQIVSLCQDLFNFNVSQKLQQYLNKNLKKYVIIQDHNTDDSEEVEKQIQGQEQQDLVDFNEDSQAFELKQGLKIEMIKDLQMNSFGCNQNDCAYSIVDSKTGNERHLLIDIPAGTTVSKKFDKRNGHFILSIEQPLELENSIGQIYATSRGFEKKFQTIQICKQNELWTMQKDRFEDLKNGLLKFVFIKEKKEENF